MVSDGATVLGPDKTEDQAAGHSEEQSGLQNLTKKTNADSLDKFHDRPDVLYCLTIEGEGLPRKFYKDQPWKGIRTGLPDIDLDDGPEGDSVLTYIVEAEGKTSKEGNTQATWRENPIDFDVKRDAVIRETYWPKMTLCSQALVDIMGGLMDYYPSHIGSKRHYTSSLEDTIVEFMYFYHELKAYLNQYLRSLPSDEIPPELDIRSCGDEKYFHLLTPDLNFGTLDFVQDPCSKNRARDLAVLLRVLAPMYRAKVAPTLSSMYLDEEPRIEYKALWVILRPGACVYVQSSAFTDSLQNRKRRNHDADQASPDDPPDDHERTACIVASWEYKEEEEPYRAMSSEDSIDRLYIQLWCIQYDGHNFQRIARKAIVPRFDGFRLTNGLEVVPANHHDRADKGELRKRLEQRGRKYLSILAEDVAHREYDDPDGYCSQIIVDPPAYAQYGHPERRIYDSRRPGSAIPIVDGDGGRRFRGLVDFQPHNSHKFSRIDEVYVLSPRRVQGLILKSKTWTNFEIDNITDTAPNFSPNQLDNELVMVSEDDRDVLRTVLPKGEKPVATAPDFITGKGEGKIFLLYGPPGTGKTLTVECVANDTRRPLITLTSQDINIRVHSMSPSSNTDLEKWFTVAAKWDAILLIDEADLFLEQRRDGDAHRNELATVFLRTLEYYKGVLFLTTNRPGHIDDSFISRITCPIAFKALTPETKAKIARKFVRKFEESGTIEVEKSAINYLIENSHKLNGRQIRNILQNAVASAEVHQRSERTSAAKASLDMIYVRRYDVKAAVERQTDFRLYLEALKGGRDEPARAKSRQDYLSIAWNE